MTMKKQCFLTTSQEKFQQKDGNGSSNTDSPTPTGKNTPAILLRTTDLYSLSGSQLNSLSEDHLKKINENGDSGEKDTSM